MRVVRLPAGTVTFLFTDVEGSTRLLQEHGDGYAALLAEHRRVLREAFARHDGVEVDTQGDAFFFAFARASDAVEAAEEAQAELEAGPIQVRMGLHTGEPLLTDEGYVGMDVHRAARIAAAGHGGQVLLSQATHDLVISHGLRDLGEHRLKDLSAAEHIWQLGEKQFPRLRALYETNLPVPVTPFVGRAEELVEAGELLRSKRLVTLTGPGGSGKTRLALQLAGAVAEEFDAGVWWTPLAPVRDASLVIPTVTTELGATSALGTFIADRRLLLVLDNFEHVIGAAGSIAALLRQCPRLVVLVTSREPLHLDGEWEYAVEPLAEADASELFATRARAVRGEFTANGEVREICARLDNLPLAIELAAARMKMLSPEALLARLGQRLPLLTAGARDAPERQRTLRGAIEWSHELLADDERTAFRRFSIFVGGSTLEAAESVCQARFETLASLVDKSLVRQSRDRFWMLETIREYGLEQLDRHEKVAEIRARHAAYFAEFAESVKEGIGGSGQTRAIERLRADRDNVRSAVAWAMEADPAVLVRLVAAVGRHWANFIGSSEEARRWLDFALAVGADADVGARAALHLGATTNAMHAGDYQAMRTHAEAALELVSATGSEADVTEALCRVADANLLVGDHARARKLYEQGIASARDGRHQRTLAQALGNIGYLLLAEGDYSGAIEACMEGVELDRALDNRSGAAAALCNLGLASLFLERYDTASASFRDALEISIEIGQSGLYAYCIDGLAAVAAARGTGELSAWLAGHSEAVLADDGSAWQPMERTVHENTLTRLRTQLGESPLDVALETGRRMGRDDAIAHALSVD